MRAARATNVVLSRLLRESEHVLAFRTSAVNVRLTIANTVALKSEKSGDFLGKTNKIRVFLAPFIEIFGEISIKSPRNESEIDRADDQLRNAREEEIHDYKNEAQYYKEIIKRVDAVASLHKPPHALAEWSFVFHIKPPGNAQGRQKAVPMV